MGHLGDLQLSESLWPGRTPPGPHFLPPETGRSSLHRVLPAPVFSDEQGLLPLPCSPSWLTSEPLLFLRHLSSSLPACPHADPANGDGMDPPKIVPMARWTNPFDLLGDHWPISIDSLLYAFMKGSVCARGRAPW